MSEATIHAAGTGSTLRVFKRLKRDRMNIVRHGFGTMPLVDVYELRSFDVVASADEISDAQQVQFYIYHTTDASARVRGPGGGVSRITVDDGETRELRIPFAEALRSAGVKYDDRSTLGDVVVEFWSAFFSEPSDPFEEPDYGNSPWLDVAVGDRRTVAELKRGGGWDDLFLQFRPRKTINWPPVGWYYPALREVQVDPSTVQKLDSSVIGTIDPQRLEVIREQAVTTAGLAPSLGITSEQIARPLQGSPPGVEVVQIGLNAVGLQLLDGGPDRASVMVLLRP